MKFLEVAISGVVLAAMTASCAPPQKAEINLTDAEQAVIQRDLAGFLDGYVAGKPQKCVSLTMLGSGSPVGDRILIYSSVGTRYRNDLRSDCPGLGRDDDILVLEPFGSQLCDGDSFRRVDRASGIEGPFCRLGMFVPYTKAD